MPEIVTSDRAVQEGGKAVPDPLPMGPVPNPVEEFPLEATQVLGILESIVNGKLNCVLPATLLVLVVLVTCTDHHTNLPIFI